MTASRYRKLAEDCLDIAERAVPEDKSKLQQMAEVWLKLATDALEEESCSERNQVRR